ncbi:MAG: hypothetical protein N4A45_00865 [Flavobacteriales bacterium]|jgi:hypothetical protein|nr:hypothetical protein [Flavobacteriales bacterium]
MTEFLISLGDFLGAATKSLMEAGGGIPNILIAVGITLGLAKCIAIIKAEKYEEA